LKGRQHFAHRSGKVIPSRKQTLIFDCFCEIKCSNLLNENQKIEVFKRYNDLQSHKEQYLYLKSLVIPVDNNNKIKKFEYFIEAKSEENSVKNLTNY